MYTAPAIIQKGSGSAESKSFEALIGDFDDVVLASWPGRDAGGIVMQGNIIWKDGRYPTIVQVTGSQTSLPLASEGAEDTITISSLPELSHPGSSQEFEEFMANKLNKSLFIAIRVGACGSEAPFYRIIGTPCGPLTLMPEGINNNDEKRHMIKFQQFTKQAIFPGRYTGTFPTEPINVVPADVATPDVAAGSGQYQLTDNSGATAITELNNAVAGGVYTLLGSGGANPSTIAAAAANFVLEDGADWQALDGSSITVTAYPQAGGDLVFIENLNSRTS